MSRKKTFPCGHSGKGRFCHRCQAAKNEQEAAANGASNGHAHANGKHPKQRVDDGGEAKADKEAWRETFDADPISLRHLPSRNLVIRARQILSEIDK